MTPVRILLRDFHTGNVRLDNFLDEMAEDLHPIDTISGAQLPLAEGTYFSFDLGTNTSATTLRVGSVIGFDGSQHPALAYGLSGSLQRPVAIVARTAPPDADLTLATAGLIWVCVEVGLTTVKGEACYVSVSEIGCATNVRPSGGNTVYSVGMFAGPADNSDRAPVILQIESDGSRIIPNV